MIRYNKKFDAFYDAQKDEWLEPACPIPNCAICKNKPEKPSMLLRKRLISRYVDWIKNKITKNKEIVVSENVNEEKKE